jgi:hypothetical protein
MSEVRETSILLTGLASAGKSTWLAALWQVFETDGFDSALNQPTFLGDQRYIIELNRAWNECKNLERTPMSSPGSVAVELKASSGDPVRLHVPDMSGELFREHWANRHWEAEFDHQVQAADGLLLMVSTLTKEGLMRREANEVEAIEAHEESEPEGGTASEAEDPPEWDPKESPSQIKLVEHLQFIALRRSQRPLRVAVMLSAWDQVREAPFEVEPRDWLRREQPLLDQYLAANGDLFPSAIYGVSAQGGDLEKDRERLLSMDPIDRLEVVYGTQNSQDLTLPLAWLVDPENG